jgi:hypothetical protein
MIRTTADYPYAWQLKRVDRAGEIQELAQALNRDFAIWSRDRLLARCHPGEQVIVDGPPLDPAKP